MNEEKQILLLTQKSRGGRRSRRPTACTRIGTLATVLQLLKLPDQTVRVLVEGKSARPRHRLHRPHRFLPGHDREDCRRQRRRRARPKRLLRTVKTNFEQYIKLNKKIPSETLAAVAADRRAGAAGRHGRGASVGEDFRPPGAAGDAFHHRAAGEGAGPDRGRDRRAAGRAQDPLARQAPDGEDPARILSQRAAEGDPEGTRRRRRRPRRDERAGRAHPQDQALQGSARKGAWPKSRSCARCRR